MNIVTVEDPIEYRLPGIVQVQVNEKAGLTFARRCARSCGRIPDVVLIGEIRDRETAEIAIQASLTGHLVLSTLHTNDAPSAVTRLIDIGVASYKIATAVKGVLAQRLVRRACTACARATPTGCAACGGTGFHGRLALVEVLVGVAGVRAARGGGRVDRANRRGGARRRHAIALEVGDGARRGGPHDGGRGAPRGHPDDACLEPPRPAPRQIRHPLDGAAFGCATISRRRGARVATAA